MFSSLDLPDAFWSATRPLVRGRSESCTPAWCCPPLADVLARRRSWTSLSPAIRAATRAPVLPLALAQGRQMPLLGHLKAPSATQHLPTLSWTSLSPDPPTSTSVGIIAASACALVRLAAAGTATDELARASDIRVSPGVSEVAPFNVSRVMWSGVYVEAVLRGGISDPSSPPGASNQALGFVRDRVARSSRPNRRGGCSDAEVTVESIVVATGPPAPLPQCSGVGSSAVEM